MKSFFSAGFCALIIACVVSADAATLTVTNTKDNSAGSLRQAIGDAAPGDTIVFGIPTSDRGYDPDTGVYTIALTSAQLTIDKDLSISGLGAKSLNVVRSANPGTPAFTIMSIAANRFVTITGLAISNGSGNQGGGIFADQNSSLLLDNVVVLGNKAVSGGGVVSKGGLLNIRNSNISNNSVNGGVGGGIVMGTYVQDNHSFGGTLHISNSTISGNTLFGAGQGAGIFANQATITIDNATISGNSEPFQQGNDFNGMGGGLYLFNGATATISNSTITGNTIDRSGAGGAGIYSESTTGKAFTLKNSIVDLNITKGQGDDIHNGFTSEGFNIIGVVSGGQIVSQQPTDQIGVTAQQLNLGSLQDNGGPGPTHALLGSSVALDRGNSGGATRDERGLPRPVDSAKLPNPNGGDGSDIGAYEVQAAQLVGCSDVDSSVHNNDDAGAGSLRDTIANVCAGTTITFDNDVTGEISLISGELGINKAVTIIGPGANILAIERSAAEGTPDFRIVHITGNVDVAISGLTIANGSTAGQLDFGGGINNEGGSLTLTNDTVSGNSATFGGGGIQNSGFATITGCTISGNSAPYSAGISGSGLLTMVNSTISGNTAEHNAGGLSVGPGMTLRSCTITNNSAGELGGGIFNNGGNSASVTVSNSIIALNTAPSSPDIYGELISLGFDIIGDDTGATISNPQSSDQIGVSADDLKLGPLKNNGGPTFTHALLPGSVAIDAGNSDGLAVDQRGLVRPNDNPAIKNASGGDGSDIGAFEAQPGSPTPTTLANISTRLRVETGDNVLIGGFIITGTQDKKVIVRAIGPSLGFGGKLANPTLELRDSAGTLLDQNDDWVDSPDKQAIIDSKVPPTNNLESAIVATLPANGAGYTAIVRGVNNGTGIGVVEAYDLDRSVDSKLANISTRGFVSTGDNVLIAGTIVLGPTSQKVIVRAIGPSLSVPGKLANPTLELRNQNGGLIEANDDWVDSPNKQAIVDSTVPPTNDLESAIVQTLPGNGASYTAIVRGVNNTTGIAVVEVYALQ